MSDYDETIVLVLKDVVFRHTEAKFLSEILTEKYGFKTEEDKIKETGKSKGILVEEKNREAGNSEHRGETIKYSTTKILSGNFSDAEIIIQILGELAQAEDTIEINKDENYKVYNSKYQLIKIAGKSGYAITQLFEQLSIDLGLEVKTKEWFFHRTDDA